MRAACLVVAVVGAAAAAAAAAAPGKWVMMDSWNALPTGDKTDAKSAQACADLAAGKKHSVFSFNTKSSHCYTAAAAVLAGLPSDHVTSGCNADTVKYCAASPGPGAALPRWTAQQPDNSKPLGGYPVARPAFTALVHRGDKVLGSYNHNVMFEYVAEGGFGFFMQWKNCQTDEDCNGQRMLYSTSADARTWAPARELFPNMTVPSLMATLEPGPPLRVAGGRVYAAASPGVRTAGNPHDSDAQGSQFCLWPDPVNPRNCGPASDVAVQYKDTLLLRRVLPAGAGLGPVFWASATPPATFAAATAALRIPTVAEMDNQTRADVLAALPDGAPQRYAPQCDAARDGSLKCEACPGGCQTYQDIDYSFGIANERTHYTVPVPASDQAAAARDVLLYRSEDHHLWASVRSLGSAPPGTAGAWSLIQQTDIPNDNSNLNAGALPDGRVYLVHNPVTPAPTPKAEAEATGGVAGAHPSQRDPVTVATSKDGVTFDTAVVGMTCTQLDNVTGCEPRYPGKSKNAGPSYPQAIAVVAPAPEELRGFYIGASVNKEDIWVSKLEYSEF